MATYQIDPAHSEIQFKVKHLMISTVTGTFNSFSGSLTSDSEDFDGASVTFSADINSIDTGNEQRDGHLKSADFFNAEEHPQLVFSNGKLSKTHNGFSLNGELTLRGVTKPLSLDVEYNGTMVDPWGQTKAGFELTGSIKRKEFGLSWDAVTEAGGVVVSDEVKLSLNVQVVKQA